MTLIEDYINKMDTSKLTHEQLNSYCIIVYTHHQYAHGITGINYTNNVYLLSEDMGFAYAAQAYKALKDKGIKPYAIKGEPSPYGNIGAKSLTRYVMTVEEYISQHKNNKIWEPVKPYKFKVLEQTEGDV